MMAHQTNNEGKKTKKKKKKEEMNILVEKLKGSKKFTVTLYNNSI